MPLTPDDTPPPAYGPGDQLRHDLKTPLTTISGHAQLLARAIRRSPSLADNERARILESLTTIEVAVREMVAVVDDIGDAGADDRRDAG
jgi:signal transduction histidine kinase